MYTSRQNKTKQNKTEQSKAKQSKAKQSKANRDRRHGLTVTEKRREWHCTESHGWIETALPHTNEK